MKIEINGNCPHCKNEIRGKTTMQVYGITETEKLTLKIFQEASIKTNAELKKKSIHDIELYNRHGSAYPQVKLFLDNYETMCRVEDNPDILKDMKQEVLKMKPKVSKDIMELTKNYKKNLVKLIDNKIKSITEKRFGRNKNVKNLKSGKNSVKNKR